MSLLDKLTKNSTIKESELLRDSEFFNEKDHVPTVVPMINVALGGTINSGLTSGLTMIAGPSKHFKTGFALLLASTYLKKYPEAIMILYDSEFGSPLSYFETFGIDSSRVLHCPVSTIEQMKNDMVIQLSEIDRKKDKVIIVVDSIGNLASKKELETAMENKDTTDMTRAKALKAFFRMITASLTIKDVPLIAVNHTYKTLEIYSKDVVGGGTGGVYGSDNIWILGREQEKEKASDKEISGYSFKIRIEKSRYLQEKSVIPITVTFDGGIQKYSGLFDLALEFNILAKNGNSYSLVDQTTGEIGAEKMARKDIHNSGKFWKHILATTDLADKIEKKYKLVTAKAILSEDEETIH